MAHTWDSQTTAYNPFMPASPARRKAFEILLRIERQAAYSSELLHSDAMAELSTADHALATELVMGVERWRSRLDETVARYSFTPFHRLDPEVLAALRLGVYQLEFLERVPARAAINESVELVKQARKLSAAPLVNAVLRKVPKTANAERAARHEASFATGAEAGAKAGRRESLFADEVEPSDLAARLASLLAHPAWLVERWVRTYGAEAAEAICRADQTAPSAALRVLTETNEARARAAGLELAPGALVRSARRIVNGHAGYMTELAVQDEGSQLVVALLGGGRKLLDCCAAPGGKTAALAERWPQADIVAVDIHPHRVRLMRQLLGKESRVRLLVADARALPLAGGFDRVLADVPCSGTGTLGRNPEIRWRLQPSDLADLAARQRAILSGAMAQVAPGGRLIYSTCSLEPEENEAVVEAALGADGEFALLEVRPELERLRAAGELAWAEIASLTRGPYLRTLPGVHPCDGFFAAVIERRG